MGRRSIWNRTLHIPILASSLLQRGRGGGDLSSTQLSVCPGLTLKHTERGTALDNGTCQARAGGDDALHAHGLNESASRGRVNAP
jgi:hypothetical protein